MHVLMHACEDVCCLEDVRQHTETSRRLFAMVPHASAMGWHSVGIEPRRGLSKSSRFDSYDYDFLMPRSQL